MSLLSNRLLYFEALRKRLSRSYRAEPLFANVLRLYVMCVYIWLTLLVICMEYIPKSGWKLGVCFAGNAQTNRNADGKEQNRAPNMASFLRFETLPSWKHAIKAQPSRPERGDDNETSTPGSMGSQQEDAAVAAPGDVVYLHGVLELTVFEAEHLHNAIHGRVMEVS
jgi:hypothetical protein